MKMNNIKLKNILFAVIFILSVNNISAQAVDLIGPEKIPDDPAAETTARRWWYMDGNRVWMKFHNDGMLGDHPDPLGSVWPKGSGINMNDGVAVIVQSILNVDSDGIPLSINSIPDTSRGERTLYFCQTNYREDMDVDPSGAFNWGFYPAVGYLNLDQDKPAISNDANSWPIGGWADAPDFVDSNGVTEWNGYFGRGKTNADLEAYFVANDAWDLEFQQEESTLPSYYPRPGKMLSGNHYQWGGLGARIGTRIFQWSHPLAQDAIFIHYDISNISDYDFDKIILSFYIDSGIGDDWSTMDKNIDMCWIFDRDGVAGSKKLGILAYSYLESPGIDTDNIDNDDDGLTDESRVPLGDAERWTDDPIEGISNLDKFLAFYSQQPKPHWVGDENQNWVAWTDNDGSGDFNKKYDDINDDVGSDGVGPFDLNYYGPDPDGSEANGKPDDGEPNYNKTDKNESDQVGLTSFQAWSRGQYFGTDSTGKPTGRFFRNDEVFWNLTSKGEFNQYLLSGKINPLEVFASGPVPIKSWRKERFSIAELHTWDVPAFEPNYEAPLLFILKKTVQRIYNSSYRFAQPPTKPRLTAIAGDGKVTLLWDKVAEKSREPFFNYIEDFEGYKVIKSTEPYFEDSRSITDGFGTEVFLKPIAQFDLEDGIKDFADWVIYNGVSYYLGNDSGIKNIYIDRDVINGRKYFYAVVAYDFGFEADNLSPSENTATITLNNADKVSFIDKNCAVVIPRVNANGFVEGRVDSSNWVIKDGSGDIEVIRKFGSQVDEQKYTIRFHERRVGYDPDKAKKSGLYDDKTFQIIADSLFVFNTTYDTTLIDTAYKQYTGKDNYTTEIFDGIVLEVNNPRTPTMQQYFWKNTQNDITVLVEESQLKGTGKTTSSLPLVPWDYSIHFANDTIYTASIQKSGPILGTPFLPGYPLSFYVLNNNFSHKVFNGADSVMVPDTAAVSIVDANNNGIFDWSPNDPFSDYLMIGEYELRIPNVLDICTYAYDVHFLDRWPKPGDVFNIKTNRPFRGTDIYKFEITETIEVLQDSVDMDNIKVVPNPYRATNLMEPNVRDGLNQRRRLMFTHIPAQCTITIFSLNGYIVDQIEVDNPPSDGKVIWDMQTREGLEIAYGLYIYKVNAPGVGEKVGKFAVIK